MIFDSPIVQLLREKYANEADYNVPYVVLLDRHNDRLDERATLERSIRDADAGKQKDWLARLCSKEEGQALSAWFEMMLYHWLKTAWRVDIEPVLLGKRPDFIVKTDKQEIVIEAKAHLLRPDSRRIEKWRTSIFSALENIVRPVAIAISDDHLVSHPDTDKLLQDVSAWLSSRPEDEYIFEDHHGNRMVLTCTEIPNLKKAGVLWSSEAQWVNPDLLKPALQEKAKANRAIREAGYPYVIALFIEDFIFSAEEVVSAWFGNDVGVLNADTHDLIETKLDQRGLHLYRKQISHKTVSGTLVFKLAGQSNFKGHFIKGWYIENPYAKTKLDASVFPVEASYLVVDKSERGYKMEWKRGARE